jgi:cyclophilin family peptidyl-prolyl cis-trans isomerase
MPHYAATLPYQREGFTMIRHSLATALALLLTAPLMATQLALADTRVNMKTNVGTLVIELDDEKAPATVKNFLEYVNDGFYDGTIFHRVIDGFMIQGGGFTQEFEQKPTRPPIANEANNGLRNDRGTIAMARTSDPNSATSQFFINVKDNASLNHTTPTPQGWGYTVFGKVVEGMDVVDKIRQLPTGPGGPFPQDVPQTPVVIEKVTLVEGDS